MTWAEAKALAMSGQKVRLPMWHEGVFVYATGPDLFMAIHGPGSAMPTCFMKWAPTEQEESSHEWEVYV